MACGPQRVKAATEDLSAENALDNKAFINEFKNVIYGDDAFYLKNKLLDCSQSPSESIKDYADRLRQKAEIAFPKSPNEADEMCLMAFIRGVHDTRIKLHLNKESFKKFSSAVKSAKHVERAYNVCESNSTDSLTQPIPILRQNVAYADERPNLPNTSNRSYHNQNPSHSNNYSPPFSNNLPRTYKNTYYPRKPCNNCGDPNPNHFQRDCPGRF